MRRMGIGLGVGINRSNYAQGIFGDYSARVVTDGGVVEGGACVDAVSGLLLNASLLLIPSGYKGGKLYSEIPTNGNGDLTWTRGSDGFRTNASGLIQRVPWNLFSQSEAFETASWTKVRSTITANSTTAPNGTTTADTMTCNDTGTSGCWATQTTTITSERTCSIYAKANTGFYFQIHRDFGVGVVFNLSNGTVKQSVSATGTIENVGNGWYKCTATFSGSGQTLFLLGNASMTVTSWASTNNESAFIWGAQLVEGTTAQTYLPTTDRLNFPRLDYTYGSCPSVLLEPQRTNLVLQSEDLTNGWSTEGLTITANQTTAPDGNTTADTLQETAVTDVHRVYRSGITTVASTNYAFSFYVKKDTRRYVRLVLNQTTNTAIWAAAQFDLDNQTYTSGVGSGGGTFVSASISPAANGFYRITLVATVTSTITFAFLALSDGTAISSADSRGCNSYAGNTSNRIWGWGAQLEAGAYPTTYIPTTSATATRVAESFSRNNIYTNGLITASGGTWFVELRNNVAYTRDSVSQINLTDSAGSENSFRFFTTSTPNTRMVIAKFVSGASTNLFTTTTDTIKVAIKWNGSTADIFVNGTKQISATAFTATQLQFLNGSAADVPKFIQQMALYPSPLSDTDCTTLTTL